MIEGQRKAIERALVIVTTSPELTTWEHMRTKGVGSIYSVASNPDQQRGRESWCRSVSWSRPDGTHVISED